jgi:hypothetical protein
MLLLASVSASLAQESGKLPYGGSEAFRFALYKKELKPVSQAVEVLRSPSDSVIVIWGNTSNLGTLLTTPQLKQFVAGGGSVLIASDSSSAGWGGGDFGVRITGRELQSDKKNCYREIANRPFIKPRQIVQGGPNSPLEIVRGFEAIGVNAVATDRPSEMFVPEGKGYRTIRLATYPQGTRDFLGNPLSDAGNNFAVSVQTDDPRGVGIGRLLVLASHRVFVNGMMGVVDDPKDERGFSFDNANWEFTKRTIDWIRNGQFQPRTRCLFIEDGRIMDKFAVEIPQPPKPPMPNLSPQQVLAIANAILRFINYRISELEDSNYFDRVLAGWLGISRLWRMFIISVTVIFLIFAMRWIGRGARRHERASALTPSLIAGLAPRGGVFRQRTTAQLEVGNLYEASRRRVRDRFDVLGAGPGQSGRMPPLLTANDLPDGPILYQSIRWLWLIGYAETPTAISPADWDRLNVLLERATTRAARGDWSFGQKVD